MVGTKGCKAEVVLYVRTLQPRRAHRRQQSVIDRLEQLADSHRIREFSVEVWGRQLPADREDVRTEFGHRLLDQLEVFEEWARRNGFSTADTFPVREIETLMTGQRMRARLLPRLCLVEYLDRDLAFVTPIGCDGDPPTIEDRLDELESGTPYPETVTPIERAHTATDRLPAQR